MKPSRWLNRALLVARRSSFVAVLLLAACGQPGAGGGDAAKTPWPGPFAGAAASPTPLPPVTFPRDEAPHDTLTEWWYYTGHLRADDGTRYGFESVIFQSLRSDFPPYYAAHVAITDRARGAFRYDQRTGPAAVGPGPGFDLRLGDWAWRGLDGRDRVEARIPGYAFDLDLTAVKPTALHNAGAGGLDGYIDFGPGGGSYYYSRTRMELRGTLDDGGVRKAVTGEAWFDHQWGNFLGINTGGGGWDWFSAQLDDGSDFTLSLRTDADRQIVASYGTFVAPDGRDEHIDGKDLKVEPLDTWTSPHTGFTYPSGWRITLPKQGLVLTGTPVLRDQELDTRASTANVYWEGEILYEGARDGRPIRGEGYIELTGYDRK